MKLKKNIIASICGITLGLAASSSAMAEHELEFELPGGDNPQLDSAQEGGFALAETLLSITAAFVTRGGCAEIGGPFSINVGRDGNGTATYGQVNPIELTVTQDQGPQPDFGTFYNVHQVGLDGQIDPTNQIRRYDGILSYSMGGAILVSDSEFDMKEFGVYVMWDEHNIKDFWLSSHNSSGKIVEDFGLEVITKLEYPISKWRQVSFHEQQDGGVGHFSAHKWLITPNNLPECHISIGGWDVKQFFGTFSVTGKVEVTNF